MEFFNEIGKTDINGDKLTKAAIVNVDEVRQWSAYYVLWLIYSDLSNAVDDVFAEQAKLFQTQMLDKRKRAFVRLDIDGDAVIDKHEGINTLTMDLVRL
jgi:hypothetical protein